MGRPRVHHTPEEVKAANRAKSKRYYNKHKAAIAVQRGVKHCAVARKRVVFYTPPDAIVQPPALDAIAQPPALDAIAQPPALDAIAHSPAYYWCDRVERINVKFYAFVGNSPLQYIDNLCTAFFTTNHNKNTIRDPLVTIASFRTRVRKYQGNILQLAGAGHEWARSEEVEKSIAAVVTSFEEILCLAEGDASELATSHTEGNMWYQQYYKTS